MNRLPRLIALWVLAVSTAAAAQGFELDLTEPEVPVEFRPTLAVIAVASGEATDDPVITARAHMLEAELIKAATGNAAFGKVISPADVATALGAGAPAALKCIDYACLAELAKALKVDRIIKGLVTKSGPASLLNLYGFDPALPEVVVAGVESAERQEKAQIGGFAGIQGKSQPQKDKEFVKRAVPLFFEVLEKIKTANGKLVIDSAENTSIATLNGLELGVGSCEKIVGRGSYEVKVTAAGYLPFETRVTVEPLKPETVKVLLVAKPLEKKAELAVHQDGSTYLTRPGLYIAAAGVLVAVVGVALGIMAKGVEARAGVQSAAGVVPITRLEAKGAESNALLANILVPTGAVLAAGGGVWFFLTPSGSGPPTKRKEDAPAAPSDSGGGFGVSVGYSGKF